MKKIIFVIPILAMFLIVGCAQQPTEQTGIPAEEPIEEPKQLCTEMWICQDENTKAYRKSDCTFEQIIGCEAGCENGECKAEESIEEPKLEETKEEPKKEIEEKCTIGFKCLDENRRGYQTSNCMFSQVDQCKYGCKDGECIKTPPPEEKKEETFSLTEGKDNLNRTGKRYSDFSKEQILENEVEDYDLKVRLYAKSSGYNYLRVESPRPSIWIIEKGIEEATRSDCMEKISEANSYGYLLSGQTLCIQTREKNIALIGGYWEGLPEEDTELSWKHYS